MADESAVTSTLVRFPNELYERVKEEAVEDDRSIHKTILRLVEQGLNRRMRIDPASQDGILVADIVAGAVTGNLPPAEVSRRLASDHAKEIRERTGTACPHPKARVSKGQCQACGEKVA